MSSKDDYITQLEAELQRYRVDAVAKGSSSRAILVYDSSTLEHDGGARHPVRVGIFCIRTYSVH